MARTPPFRKRRKVKQPRFRTGRRKRIWTARLRTWAGPILLMSALIAIWLFAKPMVEPEWRPAQHGNFGLCGERGRPFACVTDGDTVTLGFGKAARRIRLTGYDAPEMNGACPAESARAREARGALLAWLNAGPFEWDGGDEPPYDQYGRELRNVRRLHPDGRSEELAETMITAGLAGESGWGFAETDWCE